MKRNANQLPVTHASLAQVVVAYIVAFGERQPGNMPYAEAGEKAQRKLLADGAKRSEVVALFDRIKGALDVKKSYEEIAAEVKAG